MPTRDTRVVDSRSGTVEQDSASTDAVDAAEAPNGRRPELPALLDLPSDVPPAAAGQRHIAIARRRLSTIRPDEASLIAALAAVLARYTRQGDLVVTHVQAVEAAADDLRFAPVELTLGDDASFEALSQQVSAQIEESARLRTVDDLAAAGGAADDGRSPLTQVLFLREPVDSAGGVPFDLALGLDPDGETAALSYDSGVFTAGAAERLLGHLDVLLDAGRAAPQKPIWEVPLLTDAERRQLLVDWNATEAAYPDCRVEQLIARQAAATPDQVAVRHDADELTYGELDRRANQVAHRLRRLGVGPDVPVGVCIERSLDMVVALLAVWKAGGAYVPIDPAFPAERQRFMFEDAGLLALLTQESLLRDVPIPDERVICLDRDRPALESESPGAPEHDGEPEHLAYVIYTSGSTGKPKGVQVPHRALANFLTTMAERPGFASDDVLVAVTTLSFDIAGLELYLPLTLGGRVVLASRETASDPRALATLIAESEATVVQATPTTWKMLVDGGWPGRPGLKVLCGGEALPRALAEQLLERDVELWNMYGPTETTIWSTVRRITGLDEPVSIGHPIGNTTLYILDDRFQPVPVGIPGELCIGGDGLARGYYNRPDLTAERFPPHPFDPVPGARVYRTGDLARYLPDGNVEFLGRLDHQVKVRGFRIELGEVEYALARHPGVSAAVATTREDAPGDVRLVAYVIPAEGAVSGTELRRFVAEFLPAYMVPSQIVALEAFPTTPNGKIDRKALPAPTGEREIDPDKVVGPRSELERKLVRIWEDVLGVHPIGVQDDFFELGATSILAAQVFARIEHELGAKLPLAPVFQAPTIEQLVGLIENGRGGPRWTSLVPMQPQGTRPPIFCVHGGAGTILHLQPLVRRLGPDQPFYGLQMRGLNGHVGPHRTIEEMSVHYLSELRMVQPHGPYFLAGYCFGGIVAFDMAQRLLAEGEDVATLVMFNSPSPSWLRRYGGIGGQPSRAATRTAPPPPRSFVQRVAGVFAHPRKAIHVLGHLKYRTSLKIVDPAVFGVCARFDLPLPENKRDELFLRTNAVLEKQYDAHPFPGDIVIFHGEGLYDDPELGWTEVAHVVSHMVPGKHTRGNRESMAEPKVGFIAEHLQRHLAEVRARLEPVDNGGASR